MTVRLFDHTTIDSLTWPDTPDGVYGRRFLEPLIRKGIRHYIDNVDAELLALTIDDLVLPIVMVKESYTNSYVCSPYSYYITQPLQSDDVSENAALRLLSKAFLKGLGQIGRASRIDAIIYVNNWLFATDLYPAKFGAQHVDAIVKALTARYPQYAIAFRSLNPVLHGELLSYLSEGECELIPSRQVYMTDTSDSSLPRKRDLKRDEKLWVEKAYDSVDAKGITPDEYHRILKLYQHLYVSYHTPLSPQINGTFIKLIFDNDLFHIQALKRHGRLEAVAGYFERGGVLTCPFMGYDKGHSEQMEQYRLLSYALYSEAKAGQWIYHQSAGASSFKQNRGAEGHLEVLAVFANHLPYNRRMFWKGLKTIINTFAVERMKKY